MENRCSRQTQCQNSNLTSRWTQNNTNCFTATVDPIQLVLNLVIPGIKVRLAYVHAFASELKDTVGMHASLAKDILSSI